MVRIEKERRIITNVSARRDLEFKIFVGNIFLLKIHATEEERKSSQKSTTRS
jgi:hypothetical protein